MAIEYNVTADDKFFMGEDKFIDFVVYGQDGVVPFDVTGLPIEWSLRKTDKAPDPALMTKTPSVVGVYDADPAVNTQRLRLTFVPNDTRPLKPNVAYRHSMKRLDVSNNNILTYGSFTLLQATEH